jgi:hypothetical protein
MIGTFGLISRGRHAFLAAALGLAGLLTLWARTSWLLAFSVMMVLTVVLYGLSILTILLYHPRFLLARPALGAFDAPLNPSRVLHAAAFLFLGTSLITQRRGVALGVVGTIAVTVLLIVTAGIFYLGWRWHGVRLTRDGITDREPFGSLFVPWAALAAHDPAVSIGRNQIALYFDRPELVVSRGYRPGTSHFLSAGADADLLVRTITAYVTDPDRRASIGTEAELGRLC